VDGGTVVARPLGLWLINSGKNDLSAMEKMSPLRTRVMGASVYDQRLIVLGMKRLTDQNAPR